MKKTYLILSIIVSLVIIAGCGSTKETVNIPDITDAEKEAFKMVEGDTINIANEETEYQIIIIEPGFNYWLQSTARPEGYYEQTFLENRNIFMVNEWNQRVMQPNRFSPNLYEMRIDYQQDIDYGYEVNYKLYNYFIYFQRKYRQRLGPFMPRI
ncbi:MAG: DUF6146 family protein [Maribacter sp.]